MRVRWLSMAVIGALLLAALPAVAQDILQGDQCTIDASTVIEGDLLVLCRALRIEGTVRGSLIGTATTALLYGTVEGSVYLLAGRADLYGAVGRDIHIAATTVTLHPSMIFTGTRGSVYTISLSTTIETPRVPGSASALSHQLLLAEEVVGDVRFVGAALHLGGRVGGNVDASLSGESDSAIRLVLPLLIDRDPLPAGLHTVQGVEIGGALRYAAPEESQLPPALEERTLFTRVVPQPEIVIVAEEDPSAPALAYGSQAAREWVVLMGVGALLVLLLPRSATGWSEEGRAHLGRATAIGGGAFLLGLPGWVLLGSAGAAIGGALALIGLTAIGVGAAALAVALAVGGAASYYFAAAFIGRTVACMAVGALLLRITPARTGVYTRRGMWASLFAGALLVALLVSLPLVGWVINLVTVFIGWGALLSALLIRRRQKVIYYPPPPGVPARETAPLPVDDPPSAPGEENLPPGFNWWS